MKNNYWGRVEEIERAITFASAFAEIDKFLEVKYLTKIFVDNVPSFFQVENPASVKVYILKTREYNEFETCVITEIDGEQEYWTPADFAETVTNVENIKKLA